jgi:LmbE family N-acetylglucosaminyl deacetylase
MKVLYDHLYLSPHFDDAALSCGGQIALHTAAGQSVLVVTVTAADPPEDFPSETVRSLHRRWTDSLAAGGVDSSAAVASMVAQRRAEDNAAFARLGADVLHLPFLDCIYRAGLDGAPLYPGPMDMFGPPHPADEETGQALVEAFAALPAAGRVYLPLGVGHHVDHGATRRAGERVFAAPFYYEDYPYTMAPGALEEILPPESRSDWTAETIWLTEAALAAKTDAVAAYHSQLSSFFAGYNDLVARLREEGQRVMIAALGAALDGDEPPPAGFVGGETLWQRR